jgi:hypothetical protein
VSRALLSISPYRSFKFTASTLPAKPPSADAWPAAAALGFSFTLPAILEAFSPRVPCE